MRRLLLAEDEPILARAMQQYLEARGFKVDVVETTDAAIAAFKREQHGAAILDYRLADGDSLPVIAELRKLAPRVVILMLTGFGTIDVAVRAVKFGADDFLTKPVSLDKLADLVTLYTEKKSPKRNGGESFFIGESAAAHRLIDDVHALHNTDGTVLILGETGTGKSRLARHIHDVSRRAKSPFVDVNCAGLSRELVESELFGHEKGAFTGAHTAKIGLLEAANKGTLFLDEIGDIDASVQPKILKVVEEKRFRRMGDVRERHADVRLLAATHKDLPSAVRSGAFRSDLYYRIATFCIRVPPLRERPEDIPVLAEHILRDLDVEADLESRARRILSEYKWPGNIRELRNVLARAAASCDGKTIVASDIRFDDFTFGTIPPTSHVSIQPKTLNELEHQAIVSALVQEEGRVEAVARILGIPRSTLYQKLKTLGLSPSQFQPKRSRSGTGDS